MKRCVAEREQIIEISTVTVCTEHGLCILEWYHSIAVTFADISELSIFVFENTINTSKTLYFDTLRIMVRA